MIKIEKIKRLVEQQTQGTELFPVEIKVSAGNDILIYLDSDKTVTIEDCQMISKFVESNLDREAEDFSLLVSSAGLDKPLKLARQYQKNIGQKIKVNTTDNLTIKGVLSSVDAEKIVVTIDSAKNKKNKEENNMEILFQDIKETKLIVLIK